MNIRHHPSDETLARFASGALPVGPALVTGTHLAGCAACRARAAALEVAAAALTETFEPAALEPDALAHAFALIETPEQPALTRKAIAPRMILPGDLPVPRPLRDYALGRWRWVAPGVRLNWVSVPEDPCANVILLWVKPNTRLPNHTHSGIEYTQVLKGSYSDEFGHYHPGDLLEADSEIEHRPVVDSDGECICLAAIDGKLRFNGWIGRALAPFTGG